MMRGMFAAISGLRVHQTMLDVTANDIANVNTIGYKAERTSFKDALSQMQRGASAPTATLGGTDAAQIGLGVQLNGIDNLMQSGAIQSTGNPLDLAVQGDGFFRVGGVQWSGAAWTTSGTVGYTRAGNFSLDQSGNLVTQDTTDQITLSIASGPGSFSGNSTLTVKVKKGVALFSNLTLTKAGTYRLLAAVPPTWKVTSASFTIT